MRSGTVDIVFANRQEVLSLYETEDFDLALSRIATDCKLAAVTLSEEGAIILRGDERVKVDAYRVSEVVDTTGAGDLFAAGFLHGYTQGRALADCGKLGCLSAAIVKIGRAHVELQSLMAQPVCRLLLEKKNITNKT